MMIGNISKSYLYMLLQLCEWVFFLIVKWKPLENIVSINIKSRKWDFRRYKTEWDVNLKVSSWILPSGSKTYKIQMIMALGSPCSMRIPYTGTTGQRNDPRFHKTLFLIFSDKINEFVYQENLKHRSFMLSISTTQT